MALLECGFLPAVMAKILLIPELWHLSVILLSLADGDKIASDIENAFSGILSGLYGYIQQVSNLECALH
jgi:hypothetical protein